MKRAFIRSCLCSIRASLPVGLLARCAMLGAALLAASQIAGACNVPVFRFALERWISDNYALVVAHDKPLTAEQRKLADNLIDMSWESDGTANLSVQVLDLAATPDDPAVRYLPLDQIALPAAFLFYPAGFGEPTMIWQAPLTAENVTRLTCSPLRDAFVAQAVKGITATWILLESGQQAADDAAEQVLRECLTAAQQDLQLPAGVIHPSGEITGEAGPATDDNGYFDPEDQLESGIPLTIAFEVLRMSPDDPREDVLRGMLMNVVPGLQAKAGQPLAFPLFGRGRILEPLAGAEIQNDNIAAISSYLCGPCSCQVKAQNPGVDMLLDEDWPARLAGVTAIQERALPPLSGTAAITGEAAMDPAPAAGALAASRPASRIGMNSVMRNVLWATGAFFLLVIVATIGVMRKIT